MEVLQQLSDLKFVVERAYVGNLMTVLDQKAFHVSLIDFSFDPNMLRYLDEPVKTPAWPRLFSLQDIKNNWVYALFNTRFTSIFLYLFHLFYFYYLFHFILLYFISLFIHSYAALKTIQHVNI